MNYGSACPGETSESESSEPEGRPASCASSSFDVPTPRAGPAPPGRDGAGPQSTLRPRTAAVPTPAAGATPSRTPAGTAGCVPGLGRPCDGGSDAPGGRSLSDIERPAPPT